MATAFANLKCSSCDKYYDDHAHKPKTIPACGHVCCLECLQKMAETVEEGAPIRCSDPQCDKQQIMTKDAYPNGVHDFLTDHFRIQVIGEVLCLECGDVSKTTKKCARCSLDCCRPCRRRHESQDHCDVLCDVHKIDVHTTGSIVRRTTQQLLEHGNMDTSALRENMKRIRDELKAKVDARFQELFQVMDKNDTSREILNDIEAAKEFVQKVRENLHTYVDTMSELKAECARMKELIMGLDEDFQLGPVRIDLDTSAASHSIEQFGKVNPIDYQDRRHVKKRHDGTELGGKFDCIWDVKISPLTGDIYVAERNKIRIYTNDWKPIKSFDTGSALSSITINSEGLVILSCSGENCIKMYGPRGHYIRQFGASGNGEGQFNLPRYVTCDTDDKIYIADRLNHRICVHDRDGTYVSKIGEDVLKQPVGIVINTDTIIASDYALKQLFVFNMQGELTRTISNSGDRQFIEPTSLCKDQNGYVLVANQGSNYEHPPRIHVFTREMVYYGRVMIPGLPAKAHIWGMAVAENNDLMICVRNHDGNKKYFSELIIM